MANNSSDAAIPRSGYDLSIYGLADGSFYTLHIITISSLSVSVICVMITILLSYSTNNGKNFFTEWQKRYRFVIYAAICDGAYGIIHLADHIQMTAMKDHVYPKELCISYAFVLFANTIAHNLLINVIAANAFALMYLDKHLDFGRWDWRLHIWVFGVPLICAVGLTTQGMFGPTGSDCLFDAVKGGKFVLAMMTLLIFIILPTNAILYVLIWAKLHAQTSTIKKTLGRMSPAMRATHTAARSMTLFVAAYILQRCVGVVYAFWGAVSPPPPHILVYLTAVFINSGGLFNLVVFIIIRRSSTQASGGTRGDGRNRQPGEGVQNPVFSVTVNDEIPTQKTWL